MLQVAINFCITLDCLSVWCGCICLFEFSFSDCLAWLYMLIDWQRLVQKIQEYLWVMTNDRNICF
uniref:Uncharacterized protein n=1 Tax=Arundo donax TaxID=35708 RepID=A0A0A9GFC9_ARUDO